MSPVQNVTYLSGRALCALFDDVHREWWLQHLGRADFEVSMIAFGIHAGGPELDDQPFVTALKKAMSFAKANRNPIDCKEGGEAWVNPVFVISGSVYKAPFEGYKRGYFSRKERGLVVQIAVPASALTDGSPEGEALRASIRLASDFFSSKGISFSESDADRLICDIENHVRETR